MERIEDPALSRGAAMEPHTKPTLNHGRICAPLQRKTDQQEPKQPDTAYTCFWKRMRLEVVAAYPKMAAPMVSREVGRRWKALSDEERQEWKNLASKDRLRYEREMSAYQRPLKDARSVGAASSFKDQVAPKPPKSGFSFFLNHNRESLTLLNMSLNEFRIEMSQLWKRMSEADKKPWTDMAMKDQQRYDAEVSAHKEPAYTAMNGFRVQKRVEELKRIAKREPNAPALPQTAYSFYATAKRRELQLQGVSMKHNEVMREVGTTWKTLDAYEKLPFIGKAQRDVDRFTEEMEQFISAGSSANTTQATVPSTRGASKRQRCGGSDLTEDGNDAMEFMLIEPASATRRKKSKVIVPRKPMSAYNFMYLAKRAELMVAYQLSHNECSALCGRLWRQMADDERESYQRLAAQDKERYQQEVREYEARSGHSLTRSIKRTKGTTSRRAKQVPAWNAAENNERVVIGDIHGTEQMQRLEQSARAVLGSSERSAYDRGNGLGPQHHVVLPTSGFRYYVESKRGERERWTSSMWLQEWESLAEPHRMLWEEMAADSSTTAPQMDRQHTAVDFDALCGLVAADGPPPFL